MSILKILEDSNVNVEEFQFLVDLIKRNKINAELAIKKYDEAETMLKAIAIIYPEFEEENKISELKQKAEKVLENTKKELLFLNSLTKKLDL